MTTKTQSNAALLRKVARLEAQLKAAEAFIQHTALMDLQLVMRHADMGVRMKQAAVLLNGGAA